jgi:3-carboxy-cis,cis-muconate cycloisomerase
MGFDSEGLYGPMFYGEEAAQIFSTTSFVAKLIAFEVALAYALEEIGLAPAGTGQACETAAAVKEPGGRSWLALRELSTEAVPTGNLAIPFVKRLTAQVHAHNPTAAGFIHLGATSQDVLDTALVLQLREIASLADHKLTQILQLLTSLVEAHRETVMPARTWLQQGPPTTFGLKAAGWLAASLRARKRLRSAAQEACTLQFGGAVGTLASLQGRGDEIAAVLGRRLSLAVPEVSWHTHRDSLADLAAAFAILNGTLGKIARDISLLMQTEVAEASEPAARGKGGSSTMPHKRNPVSCAYILSSAARTPGLLATLLSVMPQEHERGLGGWHAEWQTLPELCLLTAGSLEHTVSLLDGLEVDIHRMEAHLTAGDYVMGESVVARLTPRLGRLPAHHLVESLTRKAIEQRSSLNDALLAEPRIREVLTEEEIRQAVAPANYLGSSSAFIDRVLSRARKEI